MFTKTRNRYLASAVHLGISIAVFSLFIFLLLKYWYPAPFFSASGGWQGLRIVAFIDIVLGPLLTLVLFSPNKPTRELASDLSMVAIMQIAALSWGIYTVNQQRPVAVVFMDNAFYTVSAQELLDQDIGLHQLDKFGPNLPVYVYIDKPDTPTELEEFLQSARDTNISPIHNFKYYAPVNEHFDEIFQHNLDIHEIISNNSEMKAEILALMKDKQGNPDELLEHHYIGLISRYRNIVLIFDQSNTIIGHASAPYKINP